MDRNTRTEVVVRVNKKAAAITNCAPSQYLTCDIPVIPTGELRVDRQHRWLSSTNQPHKCSPETEIQCEHAEDTETPMMPVFLPGYGSAPKSVVKTNQGFSGRKMAEKRNSLKQHPDTNDCVDGNKHIIRETVTCKHVDDTETPMMPVFLPGYGSAPTAVNSRSPKSPNHLSGSENSSSYCTQKKLDVVDRSGYDSKFQAKRINIPGYDSWQQKKDDQKLFDSHKAMETTYYSGQRQPEMVADGYNNTVSESMIVQQCVVDTETPMMPVFLPGYGSAPTTSTTSVKSDHGNLRTQETFSVAQREEHPVSNKPQVEEFVIRRRVDDTQTPMMPVFLPGYGSSPQSAVSQVSSANIAEYVTTQQPENDETTTFKRKDNSDLITKTHVDDTQTPMMPVFLPGYGSSPTKSTSLAMKKTSPDETDIRSTMKQSHGVATEPEIPKPPHTHRVRNDLSVRKVNIAEIFSQFHQPPVLDASNVIIYDSSSRDPADQAAEEAVIPQLKGNPSKHIMAPQLQRKVESMKHVVYQNNPHAHPDYSLHRIPVNSSKIYLSGTKLTNVESCLTPPSTPSSESDPDLQLNSLLNECTAYIDSQLNRKK